jgi:hypothetical protein
VFSTERGTNSGIVMKVGRRMAHQVDIIMSHGMTGIGRQIRLTQNIKIDGHILRRDLGVILCRIIMQFLVLTGISIFT